ncbi:DUF1049 domain-containing protein [Corynebacterium silvaticum]|uniref:DUF1049 domain-containing protein n=1 Tax=Corynebacterium silvaticum TaxID=2320431 RepID=A0A7Y4P8H0_9CORY|nr:DUF1049 domain-containing protein [Corynebacterium silvaticum]ARU46389.1 DUF1049 domain-containing protein [Corynebacterium silvaticum]MBH5299527.1 DUF1049 domain-containing protein [Corynebacterium silvaticum]NOM64154.1 DUF1049 domain-containing protein [Corynebacterium silvaticum]NON69359.1 DUF1049 domain-containing protein [Corynebacterium silvaticum]TFA94001.1 DUF1049 domain-containing protein [Corynebacterium silvaticum]
MTECYEAALAANNTTLFYGFIGLLLSFVILELTSFVVSRWATRRDRKHIGKLMADTEAELEKYRADHDR